MSIFPRGPRGFSSRGISNMVVLSRLRRKFPVTIVSNALVATLHATYVKTVKTGCLTHGSDRVCKAVNSKRRTGTRFITVGRVFPRVSAYCITSEDKGKRGRFVSVVGGGCPSISFVPYGSSCSGTTRGTSVVIATIDYRRPLLGTSTMGGKACCYRMNK